MDIKNGIICFTFDDRNFAGWINALPIFEKYNAHASFFISGGIDDEALIVAKRLSDAGHTVGLHTMNHLDTLEYFEKQGAESYFKNEVEPQLKAFEGSGIDVSYFSYPFNKRNEQTDAFLSKYFKRFRSGNRDSDKKYIPLSELESDRVMRGFGIGEYYETVKENLLDLISLAAKENLCVTFFSHDICENAKHINMDVSLLEKCLERAVQENVRVLGFGELD